MKHADTPSQPGLLKTDAGSSDMRPLDDRQRQRVASMVERFRDIGIRNMRDLPIYNHELEVEAVGFTLYGDNLVGVLITPWFMNFMVLPSDKVDMDLSIVGRKAEMPLPSGIWSLTAGGDRLVGAYRALSLHSPVLDFKTQELARIEAQRRGRALMTMPPTDEAAAPNSPSESVDESRRAFLRGRSSGDRAAEAEKDLQEHRSPA